MKKGYYKTENSIHTKCSVCDVEPQNDDEIITDNWETCKGRDMFFCKNHRVQYPCHNQECDADICNNFHSDPNWDTEIEIWDYENEEYE